MEPLVLIIAFSLVAGALIAFLMFGSYFQKRKAEIQSVNRPETLKSNPKPILKPSAAKKPHAKSHSHSHAADKVKIPIWFCVLLADSG